MNDQKMARAKELHLLLLRYAKLKKRLIFYLRASKSF